ncbi:putative sphingosine-1-phosphate lyase [Meira miltonrushii]|uniref:sphinganine-1-phosphate aldolase n=1 Tax=Meira miltonrushii TaxID=1280837 RepID=A0A316V4G0_9BASI|nr:putative sphingosine-1-phosphate lyase [Meira miltonrushii]PWN32437.1 putative sphingosine-1-phosphate lyase [Meira miltonrushii]
MPASTSSRPGNANAGPPSLVSLALSQALTVDNARTLIFYVVLYKYTLRLWRHIRSFGVTASIHQVYVEISRRLFLLLMKIPAINRKVTRELDAATKELEDKIAPRITTLSSNPTLPEYGRDRDWLMTALEDALQKDGQMIWKGGKISGAVYHGGQEMSDLLGDTIKMFMVSNPLHPDVFPGVRRMEAEVVSMVLRLYNAPETGAGTMTSGGTESILMACKAAREWGYRTKGITRPEIVLSRSAHAAFHKAGEYFKIKIIEVDVDRITRKVRIASMRRAINSNTVMVVGSAPSFGEGIIDDIDSIALLAKRSKILCHVDCCLGSFLMPFLEKAGLPSAPFDFRIDGVTSISCDTHKYGFAPKGSSIVMYRTGELRRHQYYVQPGWTGGVYASPSIAGSRPGALVAGTWAALMSMGDDGYTESCKEIVGAARKIEKGIRDEIHQLRIMGRPMVSVVSFCSAGSVNIYEVGDKMSAKGWHLSGLATEPPAIHIACTKLTVPVVDEFLKDLKAAVKEAKTRGPPGSMVQLYGLGSSSAGPALVGEIASRFLDTLYLVR